jgi:glycosyltransferase 2 family protein
MARAASRSRFTRLSAAWRGWPGATARIALVGLAMWSLLRKIDLHAVIESSTHVGTGALLLAYSAQFVAVLLASVRWRVLMGAYGVSSARLPSVGYLFGTNLLASSFSLLPIPGAAELVRGRRTRICWENPVTPYLLIGVERITGLFGLLAITAIATATSPTLQTGAVATTLGLGIAFAIGMGSIVFFVPRWLEGRPAIRDRLARVPIFGPPLAGLPAPTSATRLVVAVVLSAISQYFIVLSAAALFAPIDARAGVLTCSRIMPAVILAMFVTITPGGVGQRELVFVEFFRSVGVEPAHSFAVAVLFFSVGLGIATLGGLVWLGERLFGVKRPSLL